MRCFDLSLHSHVFHFPAVMLFALAMTMPAFCGPIHDAAKSGDIEKVKALLQDNASIHVSSKDEDGIAPLIWAVLL